MSALLDIYIKAEVLETLSKTVQKKGEKGLSLTISVSDNTSEYGQNVSGYVSQSKEDREAEKKKFYVGNGRVFWTDGKIILAERIEKHSQNQHKEDEEQDDLPF